MAVCGVILLPLIMRTVIICINARYIEPSFVEPLFSRGVLSVSLPLNPITQGGIMKKQTRRAVVVGADRLGKIPQLLKQHNIRVSRHISGRDPAHQKKGLQLPSGTEVLILLTDFLGHNVMKSFRAAAQQAGVPILACKRSVSSLQLALEKGVEGL